MKCQNCGNESVNFHFTSNINGRVTEQYLCSECAARMGYGPGALFGSGAGFGGLFGSGAMPAFGLSPQMQVFAVPQMGILQTEGKPQAAPNIPEAEQIVNSEMKERREINILREEMRIAAEREDFEKAAGLRDKIRELEG